jgi:hypothetical protein
MIAIVCASTLARKGVGLHYKLILLSHPLYLKALC